VVYDNLNTCYMAGYNVIIECCIRGNIVIYDTMLILRADYTACSLYCVHLYC